MRILFSKRTLTSEEAVACLQEKASVQCENIQTMTKTYLYPRNRESSIKSICQTLNGSLENLKCLGTVQTCFPGLYC